MKLNMSKVRIWELDNIKAILIFLVVLGHLFELNNTGNIKFLYTVIYFFHMPAFIFCSGYLSKPKNKKAITKFLLIYLIFQTVYYFFYTYILEEDVNLNYFSPYWTLWYLVALIIWNILLLFLDTNNNKKQILILAISVVIGLLIGYVDDNTNYIQRIFVYLPFFLSGYYLKKNDSTWKWKKTLLKHAKKAVSLLLTIAVLGILIYSFQNYEQWNYKWFYESQPYILNEYGVTQRIIHYMFATLFIISLLWFIPNKEYKFTYIGKYTLSIYLLHGFIIKIISKIGFLSDNQTVFLIETFGIAIFLTTLIPILPILKNKIKERNVIKNE